MKNNNKSLLIPDSTQKNFFFQMFYQAVMLVIPLIVSPYLTRTLGSNSLGVYTYTFSIAYYFVIFAMLGINRYGQRIIAERRSDLMGLRKIFWSLFVIHIIASILVLILYVLYMVILSPSDIVIAAVQTIYVASAIFDLTWLFYGLEKFKIVTLRNAVVRLLNTACIFLFVKVPDDLWIYTTIMTSTVMIGNLIMIPQVVKTIKPIKISFSDLREHIKPLFTLFAAVVAATLYTVFDKTLLGILATKSDVAFYEYSDKIINIPKMFITVISTVLYPKACMYAKEKDFINLKKNAELSMTVSSIIGFASAFGIVAIANEFAVLYYGKSFAATGMVMTAMSPLILIIGIGEVFRSQFIYALKKDKDMVKILSLNALVNIVISSIMIPRLGIYGAVIGTMAAEITGLCIEIFIVRKYISITIFTRNMLPYAVAGLIMYIGVKAVSNVIGSGIKGLLLQILSGVIIYGLIVIVLFLLIDTNKELILEKIKKKLSDGKS